MNVNTRHVAVITGIGMLLSCALLAEQQRSEGSDLPRIGFVGLRPLSELSALIAVLKEALRDLGDVEGRDYVLEVRTADNEPSRYLELTSALTALKVKLIVAASTPGAVAIHKANPAMSIVVRGPDIVGAGLAASPIHPGGIATGIDELADGISEKRLRLLK